tara:strand:+ start:280 stop:888 length:609 start_codon:yes stop_codon:yes gene_type:complete
MNWYKVAGFAGCSYLSYNIWTQREEYFISLMKKTADIQIAMTQIIKKIKPLVPEDTSPHLTKIIEVEKTLFSKRTTHRRLEDCNLTKTLYIHWVIRNKEYIYIKAPTTEFDPTLLNIVSTSNSNILSAAILDKNGTETDISALLRKYEGPRQDFNRSSNSIITPKDLLDDNGGPIFRDTDVLVIINAFADILEFKYQEPIEF